MITYFMAALALLSMGYFIGKIHGRILERAERITEDIINYSEEDAIASHPVLPSRN